MEWEPAGLGGALVRGERLWSTGRCAWLNGTLGGGVVLGGERFLEHERQQPEARFDSGLRRAGLGAAAQNGCGDLIRGLMAPACGSSRIG
uniref:Uncharacterized protein n=1 Tax=Arundo donax TaxID=35708 RepID=A0A0A9D1J6_ARUDO